jgi:flap endonuclease-1
MGIRGLTTLIKKHSPKSITVYKFNFFKNAVIAIDTSILLYKFRYLSHKNPNCHITGFLYKCLRYVTYGIVPIFVIDGKPPPEKKDVLNKRNFQRKKLLNKIKILNDNVTSYENTQEIKKLNKQLIDITKEHRDESKYLLEILGFQVITSKGEAESECAYLQKKGIVNYTFTDDTDALVLGCENVLRSNSGHPNTFSVINLSLVLEGFKMNYEEFVDLCILCGCDYCPSIPKLGHSSAYDLILKYKTIENVLEEIKGDYDIPKIYPYNKARQIFKNENNNNNFNLVKTVNFDENKLNEFLLNKNFKKEFISDFIKKFKENVEYCNQVNNQNRTILF